MYKSFVSTLVRPCGAAKALCLAVGVVLSFSPSALTAQDKKPAADKKEAPAKEESTDKEETTRDEATALKEFKTEMAAIKKWVKSKEAANKANPLAGIRMITEMEAKISKVRTDGLPEDLSTTYGKMKTVVKKMAGVFEGMPEDDSELPGWLQGKAADPEFAQTMQTLGQEANTTGEKLKEIGKKYGLGDELDFDGSDAKKGKKKDKGDDDEDSEEDPVTEEEDAKEK